MSFKDYSPTPADNTELGDGTYIGPNMLRNKVRPALQQLAADGRELHDIVQARIDLAKGDPGLAANTFDNLALFKAADVEVYQTANLVRIPGIADGSFNWTPGNYTGQADDQNIIEADSTALSVGAWVRQQAKSVTVGYGAPAYNEVISDLEEMFRASGSVIAMKFVPKNLWTAIQTYDGSAPNITSYLHSARDFVADHGGGVIQLPRGQFSANYVARSVVSLLGANLGLRTGFSAAGLNATRWQLPPTGGKCVFAPDTEGQTGYMGIDFVGAGPSVPGIGGHIQLSTARHNFKHCSFFDFADEALIVGGLECRIDDILAIGCLRNRNRSAISGVLTVTGTDNSVSNIEASCSLTDDEVYGTNGVTPLTVDQLLNQAAILLGGANNWLYGAGTGEFAGRGVHSTDDTNQICNFRADRNFGHGFTGKGQWVGCKAYANSQAADNTYDGFYLDLQSTVSGCRSRTGPTPKNYRHRYGLNVSDANSNNSQIQDRIEINGFNSYGHATAAIAQAFYPHSVSTKRVTLRDYTMPSVPNVEGVGFIIPNNATATNLTGFSGGYLGLEPVYVMGNPNITMIHGASLVLKGETNAVQVNGQTYAFLYTIYPGVGPTWVQII